MIAEDGKLRAIELPADLRQEVVLPAPWVNDSQNPGARSTTSTRWSNGKGAEQLKKAGYGPPPSG